MPAAAPPQTIHDLRVEASRRWLAWCRQFNEDGTMPPARDILEAGAILGHRPPVAVFEEHAAIVAAHDQAVEAAAGYQANADEKRAAIPADLEQRIAACEKLLVELRSLRQPGTADSFWAASQTRKAEQIRAKHPDLFTEEVAT